MAGQGEQVRLNLLIRKRREIRERSDTRGFLIRRFNYQGTNQPPHQSGLNLVLAVVSGEGL